MGRLRISGVVKAMNQARERLSQGIPENDQDQFRRWVQSVVSQVEDICRRGRTAPKKLPGPTYRAYLYLKNIDLHELPAPTGAAQTVGAGQSGKRPRVSNLIAFCSRLQTRLAALALERGQQPAETRPEDRDASVDPGLEDVRKEIQAATASVEAIMEEEKSTVQDLPLPSRRAYLWLKFLSGLQSLEAHLNALELAIRAGQTGSCRSQFPRRLRKLPIQVEFYNIPALYRTRVHKGAFRITASEGFIRAPEQVILALVCAALSGNGKDYLSVVHGYTQESDFLQISRALQNSGVTVLSHTRGQTYDLQEVFSRVNDEYFEGKLEQPNLTWNQTLTWRKLGHYQPTTDTVMISISLDRADIPGWLLDFVMYHELLHKKLGIQEINGRRYAHNTAFRNEERKFKHYFQAQEFIKNADL